MIFVANQQDLEYYSPSDWGCYSDAVFQPSDILLQANNFTYAGEGMGVAFLICDTAGNPQEDGTTYFDFCICSFVIGGTTYFFVNIRGNDYSPYVISNKCFTVKVVLTNTATGTIIFSQWTQKYEIKSSIPAVFASGITRDGSLLPLCIPGSNPATCAGFGNQYIKLSCTFDCIDAYTGDYYAQGTVSYASAAPFTYTRSSLVPAKFRDIPSEVKRTISINNRTQKTEAALKHLFQGDVNFPVWKMLEIQAMLKAYQIFVDDTEFQFTGGTVFTQIGKLPQQCVYAYTLSITFQEPYKWQTFGCVPNCDALATYYLFDAEFTQIYDDAMRPVATSPAGLRIYFDSLSGNSKSQELGFILPCPTYSIIKVQGDAVLPKFLYVNQPIPSQRIYPKQLSATATDLSPLCNGVTNNNGVPVPEVTGVGVADMGVAAPEVTGIQIENAVEAIPVFTPEGKWTEDMTFTSAALADGEVTVNISISTPYIKSPFINTMIGTISGYGRPTKDMLLLPTNTRGMPPASSLYISSSGSFTYSGPATSISGGTYYLQLFGLKYLK